MSKDMSYMSYYVEPICPWIINTEKSVDGNKESIMRQFGKCVKNCCPFWDGIQCKRSAQK